MTLDAKKLESELRKIQQNSPLTYPDAAARWAGAIYKYALDATPGGQPAVITANLPMLTGLFAKSIATMTFMVDLGINLQAWWQAVTWASVAITAIVATANGVALKSPQLGEKIKNNNIQDPSNLLASEIDKWTKTIIVTITNIQTGATSSAIIM